MFGRLPQPCQPSLAERGWNSLQTNSILLGNGSGRISTTTAGTDGYVLALSAGVPTWLATSTLSNITGTLAVAKGGTGQTSFGQGWLNSDGTTLTSTTSPTVAYFTATSTAQASTFPYASTTALTVSGSAYLGSLNGPLQANGGLVSATTSVGYQYGGTGLTAAPSFGQILRGTGSGYSLVATSTLGINTTDLTEGSNLFWTNDRFGQPIVGDDDPSQFNHSSGVNQRHQHKSYRHQFLAWNGAVGIMERNFNRKSIRRHKH